MPNLNFWHNISSNLILIDNRLVHMSQDTLNLNPFLQFSSWFQDAKIHSKSEYNACILATASLSGQPSARVVLLKHFDENGFVIFTNYHSRKAQELLSNNKTSLLFYWPELYRQIRIEGFAEKVTEQESNEYFATRPRGSQIGAHASPQSQIIPDRQFLEMRCQEVENKYHDKEIPRPEFWGGFRIVPICFEFWLGQENRLHDRFFYENKNKKWTMARLAP